MVGIAGYGVAIPRRRIRSEEIRAVWKNMAEDMLEKLGLSERCVTGPDEDAISLGIESARACLKNCSLSPGDIDALIFASGTNPYSTKAAATVVQDALGLRGGIFATDIQFAGRSGADGLVLAQALCAAGQARNVLVIASDALCRHIPPGHALEYAASAAAVSMVVSRNSAVKIIDWASHSSDRSDWFRVSGDRYMQLGSGFQGYMNNWGLVENAKPAWDALVTKAGLVVSDLVNIVVPQTNAIVPLLTATKLGLPVELVLSSILSSMVGDTGCSSVVLSMCHYLDYAEPGEKFVVLAYGWGGGATAFLMETEEKLSTLPRPQVLPQIEAGQHIDYARALKYENKLFREPKGMATYY